MKIGIISESRYIDADKLLQQVTRKKPEVAKVRYSEGFNDAIMRVRSMIHSAPTADVVEVVRCKDCLFSDKGFDEGDIYCKLNDASFAEDGFCSYGKRKEDT